MSVRVHLGDCRAVLRDMDSDSVDSAVTDPPYHLTSIVKRFGASGSAPAKAGKTGAYARASTGFMGQKWDGGDVAFQPETWAEVWRVLKPGAHLVAFSGTRTFHRMVCAIEDAGFEIRDTLCWHYGSGFPKSHDVSKGIDRHLGSAGRITEGGSGKGSVTINAYGDGLNVNFASRPCYLPESDKAQEWAGWGTALKPATELICLARKPLSEKSIAANVLRWGTGALNIGACRIDSERPAGWAGAAAGGDTHDGNMGLGKGGNPRPVQGRWPANLLHDGGDDVVVAFPADGQPSSARTGKRTGILGEFGGQNEALMGHDDRGGSAARFFYSAKAGPLDRLGSAHPTVKPVDLMRWLCRLVTPHGGSILDPFAGSGTTGIAALAEGFRCEMIDIEEKHVADIERKLAIVQGEGRHMLTELNERKAARSLEPMPLFGDAA